MRPLDTTGNLLTVLRCRFERKKQWEEPLLRFLWRFLGYKLMKDNSGPKIERSFAIGLFALALFGPAAYAADLTVQVAKVSSDSGNIRVALHDGEEGFPSKREPAQIQLVKADTGGVTVVFSDVTPPVSAFTS